MKRYIRFIVGMSIRDEVHELFDEIDEEEATADDDYAHWQVASVYLNINQNYRSDV